MRTIKILFEFIKLKTGEILALSFAGAIAVFAVLIVVCIAIPIFISGLLWGRLITEGVIESIMLSDKIPLGFLFWFIFPLLFAWFLGIEIKGIYNWIKNNWSQARWNVENKITKNEKK
jgi:hypothetical protein